MNCQLVKNRLGPYLDGELDGTDMLLLRKHLCACARCAAELESYKDLKRLIGSLPPRKPGAGFEARLLEAVRKAGPEPHAPQRSQAPWVSGLRWTAAFSMGCAAAFGLFQLVAGDRSAIAQREADKQPDVLVYDQDYDRAGRPFSGNTIPAVLDQSDYGR